MSREQAIAAARYAREKQNNATTATDDDRTSSRRLIAVVWAIPLAVLALAITLRSLGVIG
jgi:hypothetical protein